MAAKKKPIGESLGHALQKFLHLKFNPFKLSSFVDWAGGFGVSRGLVLWIFYIGLFWILSLEVPHLPLFAVEWLIGTAPIWLLLLLYLAAVKAWIWYIQSLFLAHRDVVLLEVKMPREITKSPRAMEIAFTSLSISSGETTYLHRVWKGQVRPFFSFEIASFGGEIHFYIWCWRAYRDIIEGMMYAQYPEVELYEVEDYASKFRFDPNVYTCFGTEWRKQSYMSDSVPTKYGGLNDDSFRINAYQIRTYVDFELDDDPKEEFKVDPLSQVLEFMGSIRPDEQLWIQIVLRKSGKWRGTFRTVDQDTEWKTMLEEEINIVREKSVLVPVINKELGPQARAAPSWRFSQMIEKMERNLGKYPFEVGMRGVYISSGDFRGPFYTGNRWIWRPYGNPQYGVHLRPRRWHNDFDYPWQDFHNFRYNNQTRRFLDAYRRRMFYHTPWVIPTNVFTNEELATIWHPPSSSVRAPGLQRVPATKAAPPSNLPM